MPFLRAFGFPSTHKSNQKRPFMHMRKAACAGRGFSDTNHSGTQTARLKHYPEMDFCHVGLPRVEHFIMWPKKVNTHNIFGPGVQLNV